MSSQKPEPRTISYVCLIKPSIDFVSQNLAPQVRIVLLPSRKRRGDDPSGGSTSAAVSVDVALSPAAYMLIDGGTRRRVVSTHHGADARDTVYPLYRLCTVR